MTRHVVLLGDSIFDNARYVPGEQCLSEQLRDHQLSHGKVTLAAVDGAVINDVQTQLQAIPKNASHLVISVGGNDALHASRILPERVNTVHDGMGLLAKVVSRFEQDYRHMLDGVLALKLPTAICTIYDGVPSLVESARVAVRAFNDVITRAACQRGLPVIDLREICTEPGDYSEISDIEPSNQGGAKIVRAIGEVLDRHDFASRQAWLCK